jgi:hypothetical protein
LVTGARVEKCVAPFTGMMAFFRYLHRG